MWVVALVLPVLFVVGLSLSLARRPVVGVATTDAADLTGVRRHRLVASIAGPLLGLAAGWWVLDRAPYLGLGLSIPLAASAVLLTLLVVVCATELTVGAQRGTVRTASLARRRPGDLIPRRTGLLAAGGALVLAVLLGVGWTMGDADDQGRPGRALATAWRGSDGLLRGSAHGPWPGSFYAGPMLAVLAVAIVLTGVTVAVVAGRARPTARSAEADLALRRATVSGVLHASAALTWLLATPVALLMAAALLSVGGAPVWYAGLGAVCLVTALAGGLLGSWSLGRTVVQPRLVVRPSRRGEPVAG